LSEPYTWNSLKSVTDASRFFYREDWGRDGDSALALVPDRMSLKLDQLLLEADAKVTVAVLSIARNRVIT